MEQPGQESAQRLSLPSNTDLLKVKVRLGITRLFKSYLYLIEELVDEHDLAMGHLIDALPPEQRPLVILSDHFTDTRMEAVRKRVLTLGNNEIRELEQTLDALRLDR